MNLHEVIEKMAIRAACNQDAYERIKEAMVSPGEDPQVFYAARIAIKQANARRVINSAEENLEECNRINNSS